MKGKILLFTLGFTAVLAFFGCRRDLDIAPTEVSESLTDDIYYTSAEEDLLSIYNIANGVKKVIATDNDSDYWYTAVAPNKQKIVCYKSTAANFYRVDDYAQAQLWIFNADGSEGKPIIGDGKFGLRAQAFAHWHPNGKNLIMAVERKDPENNNNWRWHLAVTDTGGNNIRQLTSRAAYFAYPQISPNGLKIAYTAFPIDQSSGNQFESELFVADLDTNTWTISNEQQLTTNTLWEQNPQWSADMQSIIFSQATNPADIYSNVNLVRINLATNTVTPLTFDSEAYQNARFNNAQTAIYLQNRLNSKVPYAIQKLELTSPITKATVIFNPDIDIYYPTPY